MVQISAIHQGTRSRYIKIGMKYFKNYVEEGGGNGTSFLAKTSKKPWKYKRNT